VADRLRTAFEIHVVSFLVGVQTLAARLAHGRGSVVAMASAAIDIVYPGSLANGTTKAALRRVIDQLAVELAPRVIGVNSIAPGAIATPMTERRWAEELSPNSTGRSFRWAGKVTRQQSVA
jgi:3-oxoacyl-[acyl-carrier protein] reductase